MEFYRFNFTPTYAFVLVVLVIKQTAVFLIAKKTSKINPLQAVMKYCHLVFIIKNISKRQTTAFQQCLGCAREIPPCFYSPVIISWCRAAAVERFLSKSQFTPHFLTSLQSLLALCCVCFFGQLFDSSPDARSRCFSSKASDSHLKQLNHQRCTASTKPIKCCLLNNNNFNNSNPS